MGVFVWGSACLGSVCVVGCLSMRVSVWGVGVAEYMCGRGASVRWSVCVGEWACLCGGVSVWESVCLGVSVWESVCVEEWLCGECLSGTGVCVGGRLSGVWVCGIVSVWESVCGRVYVLGECLCGRVSVWESVCVGVSVCSIGGSHVCA